MPLDDVVVVGASLAGLRAVEALRARGFEGRITVIGAEKQPPYDRPPLSKEILTGKWDAPRTALRAPESYAALAADWRLGTPAEALDLAARTVVLAGGERVRFDGLVIATGATPRALPGAPPRAQSGAPPLAGVHVLRSLDDALAVRAELERGARLCVVGAGFIGAEVAASARARGCEVTLLEALPLPLGRALGRELGEFLAGLHRDAGVGLRCGASVAALEGSARVEAVRLADGSRVPADCVVVGIGVVPETRWLAGSGLALGDGVLCDASCAASAPGVVACGDVARWHNARFDESMRVEHWTNASEQADAAIARLLAGPDHAEPFTPVPYFWSDQYDVKIQLAGRARPDDTVHVAAGSPAERRFLVLYGRAGRLVGVLGVNRARLVMKYRGAIREGMSFEAAVADL